MIYPRNVMRKIEHRYIIAAIYAVVLFLDRLDLTIVNITLPTLANYFRVPITQTEWINNAFLVALAISIPISGWAGDRFGTKKMFIIATGIFGLTSLLCAFSPTIFSIVILRFFQGISGGMIIPVGMTMVYREFSHAEYASITSFIFIPTLVAPAIAPALGGIILYYSSWQWVFLLAVPICVIVVLMSIFILKEHRTAKTPPLDWKGFVLSSCALIFMLGFISSLGKQGFNLPTISFLAASVFFVYSFLKHEKCTQYPLIDIKFFKNKLFLQANLIQVAFQICHFGSIFLIGMYLQIGVGMSAMMAGGIMGMQAVGAICISRYSVHLFHQFGPGLPIVIGFIGIAILTPCILLVSHTDMMLGMTILFVRGLFSGLCGTPIQTASVIGFDKGDVSRASAIFNAGRQISISLGIALSSLLMAYGLKSNGLSNILLISNTGGKVFYDAFMLIPVVSMVGIVITMTINNKNIMRLMTHDVEQG